MGESRAKVEAETVERVARLVTTAGATLKEKKRPIKVVARDGTVKKVVPHVEVIEGLLHHEGISGGEGARPRVIQCEKCGAVVAVRPVGAVPSRCRKHPRDKDPRVVGRCQLCSLRDVSHRSKTGMCRPCLRRLQTDKLTASEKSTLGRHARFAVSAEGFKAGREKFHQTMSNKTEQQRRDGAKKALGASLARTPEQRSAAMRKAWETRRAKKAAAEKAGEQ